MTVEAPVKPAPKIDVMVENYVKLRDIKAQMKKEYEAQVAPVDAAMEKIEAAILAQMQATGSNAFKTAAGTAFIAEKTSVTVADWDSFFGFVQEKELWHLINHAASKTAMEEYKAANDDLPPGLNYRVEAQVQVRRPSKS